LQLARAAAKMAGRECGEECGQNGGKNVGEEYEVKWREAQDRRTPTTFVLLIAFTNTSSLSSIIKLIQFPTAAS
jgi:hypothetical protein